MRPSSTVSLVSSTFIHFLGRGPVSFFLFLHSIRFVSVSSVICSTSHFNLSSQRCTPRPNCSRNRPQDELSMLSICERSSTLVFPMQCHSDSIVPNQILGIAHGPLSLETRSSRLVRSADQDLGTWKPKCRVLTQTSSNP